MLLLATEDADRGWEDGGGKWITVFGYGAFVGGGDLGGFVSILE